jgi:hypothetical protein
MVRKHVISPESAFDNGASLWDAAAGGPPPAGNNDPPPAAPPPEGEGREPDGEADTSFDPAALEAPAAQATGPDPFDPAALRIESDFNTTVGLKKAVFTVRVRKPDKSWWSRAHPDPSFELPTAVIELRGERGGGETYLVAPALRAHLATEPTLRPKLLVTAVNTQGELFLWEVNLPRDDREDNWSKTALAALDLARRKWVRVAANMSAGGYDCWEAAGNLPEPSWPDLSFREVLELAFKDKYIKALDHPILRRLRGEVG